MGRLAVMVASDEVIEETIEETVKSDLERAVKHMDKRTLILSSGLTRFSQFGLSKTSMQDIADCAGISRASLYSYFKNKDEVFRSVSILVHQEALQAATTALEGAGNWTLGDQLISALYARHGRFLRLVLESAQGAELEDEYGRLCGDVVQDYGKKFESLLTRFFTLAQSEGWVDLSAHDLRPARVAQLLNLSAAGCKRNCRSMTEYQKRVASLVHMTLGGLAWSGEGKNRPLKRVAKHR